MSVPLPTDSRRRAILCTQGDYGTLTPVNKEDPVPFSDSRVVPEVTVIPPPGVMVGRPYLQGSRDDPIETVTRSSPTPPE